MILETQNGKAVKIRKHFCGIYWSWPTDSSGHHCRAVMTPKPVCPYVYHLSSLPTIEENVHYTQRRIHFVLTTREVTSSTRVPRKPMCSLESSNHLMKHIHFWIRTTWLQLGYESMSISIAFKGWFYLKILISPTQNFAGSDSVQYELQNTEKQKMRTKVNEQLLNNYSLHQAVYQCWKFPWPPVHMAPW